MSIPEERQRPRPCPVLLQGSQACHLWCLKESMSERLLVLMALQIRAVPQVESEGNPDSGLTVLMEIFWLIYQPRTGMIEGSREGRHNWECST